MYRIELNRGKADTPLIPFSYFFRIYFVTFSVTLMEIRCTVKASYRRDFYTYMQMFLSCGLSVSYFKISTFPLLTANSGCVFSTRNYRIAHILCIKVVNFLLFVISIFH